MAHTCVWYGMRSGGFGEMGFGAAYPPGQQGSTGLSAGSTPCCRRRRTWPPRAPGAVPGRLPRLGRLPERKVGGAALALVHRHALAGAVVLLRQWGRQRRRPAASIPGGSPAASLTHLKESKSFLPTQHSHAPPCPPGRAPTAGRSRAARRHQSTRHRRRARRRRARAR